MGIIPTQLCSSGSTPKTSYKALNQGRNLEAAMVDQKVIKTKCDP